MNRCILCFLSVTFASAEFLSAQQPPAAAADADRAAVQATIDAYLTAFNRGDAAALAALWTERGEMFTPAGDRLQGREQIEKSFAEYFRVAKLAKLELTGTNIDILSPSTAVETGTARVIVPDEEPSETVYRVVHVKTADGWKIDGVREQAPAAPPPSHYDRLKPLEWMIGEWGDAAGSGAVETACRWSKNRNFIIQSFRVNAGDAAEFEGTQVIGWDPRTQVIRSWLFDSDGGFGTSVWKQAGERWTVESVQVLPDGRVGSSTQIHERVDDDTRRFRSIGRQVEGEPLPGIGPLTAVRKP